MLILTIQPNEFVGLLGPSGAGKSTLMDSLNGMRPATSGYVLINNLDLYQHLDSLKQSIGYVPQDDIIHRELTVYRTLYYVARLRLSRDVSTQGDRSDHQRSDGRHRPVRAPRCAGRPTLRRTAQARFDRRRADHKAVRDLSGRADFGSRSGDRRKDHEALSADRRERAAPSILTTHAMENVKLFDKIVVLMRGKLVFYGAPQEALAHVKAESFKDLYDKLEDADRRAHRGDAGAAAQRDRSRRSRHSNSSESRSPNKSPTNGSKSFQTTEHYRRNVVEPLERSAARRPRRRAAEAAHDRYRFHPPVGHAHAPLHGSSEPRQIQSADSFCAGADHRLPDLSGGRRRRCRATFHISCSRWSRVWFGTSVASREIIRERAVYTRERMVNLGLMPYVGSKIFVLALIVGCAVLAACSATLKMLHLRRVDERCRDVRRAATGRS